MRSPHKFTYDEYCNISESALAWLGDRSPSQHGQGVARQNRSEIVASNSAYYSSIKMRASRVVPASAPREQHGLPGDPRSSKMPQGLVASFSYLLAYSGWCCGRPRDPIDHVLSLDRRPTEAGRRRTNGA